MQKKLENIHFSEAFWEGKIPLTDSRLLQNPQQTIFFALKGRQQDGHIYIEELYRKGVRHFVLGAELNSIKYPEARYILVSSPLVVLQAWAAWHRQQFGLDIIAITGSNGKTIIKEWLYQLLHHDFVIVKSPKSYNSQLGVPLSVLQIRPSDELAIFEAGISKKGEMGRLQQIIQPKIGIFTNIGQAHAEGFDSLQEKIEEKLQLFQNAEILIYCTDHTDLHRTISQTYPEKKILNWGRSEEACIKVLKTTKSPTGIELELDYNKQLSTFRLPFSSAAAIENAIHCIALMLYLNYDNERIQHRLWQLRDLPMRLEWKEGIRQTMLIDDTYNNDLGGLRIALEFMGQKHKTVTSFNVQNRKTLILSDIPESGMEDVDLYCQVAQLVQDYKIEKLIGIGRRISAQKPLFAGALEAYFYLDTETFLNALEQEVDFQHETILIKGARSFEFERIVRRLRKRSHSTVLELDLNAILHNYKVYRALLRPETKVMAMVKASAYGSGSYEVAHLLEYHGADYLGVAYSDEGVQLRQRGIALPIMVMNTDVENFDDLLRYQLEPAVFSLEMFIRLLAFLQANPPQTAMPIHIEVDSGMHRLGFEPDDLAELLHLLKTQCHLIRVVSVFSHLAAADESAHNDFTNQQISDFEAFAGQLMAMLSYPIIKHILNSAGISRFADKQLDMVRLGIGLHGIDPNQLISHQLEQVATLRSMVSQVKTVKAGESVGYGRAFKAESERQIATIAIGYADGFWRAFSNGVGQLLIRGHLCPIVGKVCMDMCFADVTNLGIVAGDDVIVFGTGLPIEQVAAAAHTIPYEILTHISPRVPRVFFEQ